MFISGATRLEALAVNKSKFNTLQWQTLFLHWAENSLSRWRKRSNMLRNCLQTSQLSYICTSMPVTLIFAQWHVCTSRKLSVSHCVMSLSLSVCRTQITCHNCALLLTSTCPATYTMNDWYHMWENWLTSLALIIDMHTHMEIGFDQAVDIFAKLNSTRLVLSSIVA